MSLIVQAIAFLLDGANWSGGVAEGLGGQLLAHLLTTAETVLLGIVIAVPIGLAIGHTGRGRGVTIPIINGLRALPTLGLLSILAVAVDLGALTPVVALVLLAIPPLLAGAYGGVESVDRLVVDAAKAQGMTGWQILTKVELPLAAPLLVGGLRAAVVQTFATVTVAAYFGFDSLGGAILQGLASANYAEMIAGALLVVVLALAFDGLFALLQTAVVPRGVSRGTARSTTTARGRRSVAATATPLTESD